VSVRMPATVPVALGRRGVRSPSKYGTMTTPPEPRGQERAIAASSSGPLPSQRATVKDVEGTLPQWSTHQDGGLLATRASTSSAQVVSFQSLAGLMTLCLASSATRPCCWAAREIAAGRQADLASSNSGLSAYHHDSGSCSLTGGWVGGCGLFPSHSSLPEAIDLTSSFVDCVEESTPKTTSFLGHRGACRLYRTPRSSSMTSWSSRSSPQGRAPRASRS
jgi:hypothetical protein